MKNKKDTHNALLWAYNQYFNIFLKYFLQGKRQNSEAFSYSSIYQFSQKNHT